MLISMWTNMFLLQMDDAGIEASLRKGYHLHKKISKTIYNFRNLAFRLWQSLLLHYNWSCNPNWRVLFVWLLKQIAAMHVQEDAESRRGRMCVIEHAKLVVPDATVSLLALTATKVYVPAMLSSRLIVTSPSALSYLLTFLAYL